MDRFTRGFIAGIVGGLTMHLWTLVALNILNWEIIRFIDWALNNNIRRFALEVI